MPRPSAPGEVVELLNEFFRVVVDVIDRHHGFVNKFMGDAALAIFGAPLDRPDAPTAALAAARELRFKLNDITGLDVGIGVSAGLAVAGNIGAAERFEYTVIGDPVNEASRLTELAKLRPSRVLRRRARCTSPTKRNRPSGNSESKSNCVGADD